MTYLPAPIFFVIAFIFSMLGIAGSQLYMPILFWSGMDFKTEAIPLGMLLNLVNSASAAVLMLSGWRPERVGPAGHAEGEMSPRGRTILGLTTDSGLGMVAGLIGRGGGSFIVPLLYITGLEAQVAAATSAPIVTCSGLSSFVSHLATAAQPAWPVWAACVGAVLLGSQLGSRLMAQRMRSKAVKQGIRRRPAGRCRADHRQGRDTGVGRGWMPALGTA
jgi:hypothetical protein